MAAMLSASRSLTAITSSLLCRGVEGGGRGHLRVEWFEQRCDEAGQDPDPIAEEEKRVPSAPLICRRSFKVHRRAAAVPCIQSQPVSS